MNLQNKCKQLRQKQSKYKLSKLEISSLYESRILQKREPIDPKSPMETVIGLQPLVVTTLFYSFLHAMSKKRGW